MSYEPPTPPAELPNDLLKKLDTYSPERLQYVSDYAEALAEYRERGDRLVDNEEEATEGEATGDREMRPDDFPEDVPTKATITVKEINDNCYYYWQWREGDTIKSKYKGAVTPDE